MNLLEQIPNDLIQFLLVTLFALLIGLEQRRHHEAEKAKFPFGTDRTFALIGILGFVLYVLDREYPELNFTRFTSRPEGPCLRFFPKKSVKTGNFKKNFSFCRRKKHFCINNKKPSKT